MRRGALDMSEKHSACNGQAACAGGRLTILERCEVRELQRAGAGWRLLTARARKVDPAAAADLPPGAAYFAAAAAAACSSGVPGSRAHCDTPEGFTASPAPGGVHL